MSPLWPLLLKSKLPTSLLHYRDRIHNKYTNMYLFNDTCSHSVCLLMHTQHINYLPFQCMHTTC